MNPLKLAALCGALLTISACNSPSGRYHYSEDHSPKTVPPLQHIEDVTPRYEPYSRGGNRDYRVRGIDYKVYRGITEHTETGFASWYGKKFHGHLTSNGERYNMFAMSAAHKNLPLPSYVEVTNLENNKKIIVRVNDRGPFHEGRIIDLSYAAANKLDVLGKGTAKVAIKLLHFPEKKQHKAKQQADLYIQYMVTGSTERAQQLNNEMSETYGIKGVIVEEAGHYKLRLGHFTSELDAQIMLAKVQAQYPQAFIVQPSNKMQ